MLANTLTVGGVTLTRIKEGDYSSEYRKVTATEEYRLIIRHSNAKPTPEGLARDRHNIELVITTFPTATAPQEVSKAYWVAEQNANNTSIWTSQSLLGFMTASDNAILTAVHGWDS